MADLNEPERRIVRAHSSLVVQNVRPTIRTVAAFADLDVETVRSHIAKLHAMGQLADEPTMLAPVAS